MAGREVLPLAASALVAALLAPLPAAAGMRLACKGVLTFADAMTRAVHLAVDPERALVHLPDCARYAELHGFCHGEIRDAHDHRFRFGWLESREETRLGIALWRDDAVPPEAPSLKAVFLGHCAPAWGRRWARFL